MGLDSADFNSNQDGHPLSLRVVQIKFSSLTTASTVVRPCRREHSPVDTSHNITGYPRYIIHQKSVMAQDSSFLDFKAHAAINALRKILGFIQNCLCNSKRATLKKYLWKSLYPKKESPFILRSSER